MRQKNQSPVYLVVDARTADQGVSSGIARFVVGIVSALAAALDEHRKNHEHTFHPLRILVVSQSGPADWIVDLVNRYPKSISFWALSGKGFVFKKLNKLSWLWPTFSFRKLRRALPDRVIWFAPANFDRPLFVSNTALSSSVIQVVHDAIPFSKLPGFGFFFRRHFRFLVARSLTRLPHIVTVSQHAAQALASVVKKRRGDLPILRDAVDDIFGGLPKVWQKADLRRKRLEFLKHFGCDLDDYADYDWVLGVGRSQRYKCWDVALQAVEQLNQQEVRRVLFIRVGADHKEIAFYHKKSNLKEYGQVKAFPQLNLCLLSTLSDTFLARLYALSDLLIHPSLAEGFGLPPIEAALSGLPVLYRKGTAVDEHFPDACLPQQYWVGLESPSAVVWSNQIERLLCDPKDSMFYKGLYESKAPRQYILDYSGLKKSFAWEDSAQALLSLVVGSGGVLDGG